MTGVQTGALPISEVAVNVGRGGNGKCLFIYNAHMNRIHDNRFEGCPIGIHFTAGSERNRVSGNAFVGNQAQVKYVGTRRVEWTHAGRGHYWSDKDRKSTRLNSSH